MVSCICVCDLVIPVIIPVVIPVIIPVVIPVVMTCNNCCNNNNGGIQKEGNTEPVVKFSALHRDANVVTFLKYGKCEDS